MNKSFLIATHDERFKKISNCTYNLFDGDLIKMSEKYNKNVKKLLQFAEQEAHRLFHTYVGSEHICYQYLKIVLERLQVL